mmetsp:Transcript_49110/g.49886  ORF Transcript_49110/g.49886 Transcript_49110/m.49886 type:complete len:120 (-) Transcript_49110:69-428(-)
MLGIHSAYSSTLQYSSRKSFLSIGLSRHKTWLSSFFTNRKQLCVPKLEAVVWSTNTFISFNPSLIQSLSPFPHIWCHDKDDGDKDQIRDGRRCPVECRDVLVSLSIDRADRQATQPRRK